MSEGREEAITFRCAADRLVAIVHHVSDPRVRTGILIVVGGPQFRVGSHRQFTLMARALAAASVPVMRFDYRGMGDSDGEMRSFESIREDLLAAIDAFMRSVPSLTGVVLWGLCDAASAILMDGTQDPRACGLILANPWVRTQAGEAKTQLRHYYLGRLLQGTFWSGLASGRINLFRALLDFARTVATARSRQGHAVSTSFIDRMQAGLERFEKPILLLISGRDLTAQEFTDHCAASPAWQSLLHRSNVRIERFAEADHTFSQRDALDLAVARTLAWLAPPGVDHLAAKAS
jgi:uncharacterized protein